MADNQTTKQLSSDLGRLTEKVLKLQKEMEGLSRSSLKYKETQKELNKVNKEAIAVSEKLATKQLSLTKNNKNHAGSIKAADGAQKKFNATQSRTGKLLASTGKGILGVAASLGRYLGVSAAIAAAVGAMNELFIKSAKRAIDLEKAMADVAAVAGLTSSELDKIRRTAFDVAGATSLTVIEVSKLQKELAKLGLTADEIQELTKPVALLSQALGESGEVTGQTLQKIQNQFLLTSDQATQTANALVGAVNESALTMNDLATGLQYVGPLAVQAGQSFSETAAQLGILADNGFKASRAGTGLRTVLIEAAKQGKPVEELLSELAESGLSVARATEIFTKRGAAAAIVLARNYREVNDLNFELEESDRLFQANAKQMGTVRGQIDLLASAYNKASTNLGEWITKTNFFIGLTYNLDKQAGAQAAAYKFIANNATSSADAIDRLIDAQRAYEKGGVSELYKVITAFRTIQGEVEITEQEFIKQYEAQREVSNSTEEALQSLIGYNNELNNASILVQGLLDITREQSLLEDKIYLDRKAVNEQIVQYRSDYAELSTEASQGLLDQKDKEEAIRDVKADQLAIAAQITALEAVGVPTREDKEEIEVLKRRLDLLAKVQTQLESLFNVEQKDKTRKSKDSLDLNRYKIERDARLQELKDRKAFELQAAKSAEERNDIEIEYAALVAQVNKEAAEGLAQIDASLYSNQVSIESTIAKWEALGEVSGEDAVGVFKGFLDEFNKAVDGDIDKFGNQLKNGEISVNQYNDAVAKSIETNKSVVQQALLSLTASGKLTQEQAEQLQSAVDRLNPDNKEMFQAEETLLGRVLGLDVTEYIGESLQEVNGDYREEAEKQVKAALSSVLKEVGDIYDAFAKERLDNVINEKKSELDVIKERYEIEEDILKSSLENQLITESQFRAKSMDLKKAQLAEENSINKQIFEAEKQQDQQSAIADGLEAAAIAAVNAWKTGEPITAQIRAALSVAAIAAGTTARVAAINQRKFFPKKFADGGMVSGPSHEEGGVPFTVQGQGGYEMEGGEYIINKRSAALHKDLLDRINNSSRTDAIQGKRTFADGGQVIGAQGAEGVEYLKVIAMGTADLVKESKKPTRAWVSNKDLNKDSRERSIRQKNDRV